MNTQEMKGFLQQYEQGLQDAADRLRNTPMPALTEELFGRYEQDGNRIAYEQVYFTRRKYLAVFGAVSILYNRKRDLKKLSEVIMEICAEKCWALPAHVSRADDPDWAVTVELFASETGQALTEITEMLKKELPAELIRRVEAEVDRRILQPYFQSAVPYAWWEISEMNWNAVCAGSIGSICLYRYRDDPVRLQQCLTRVKAALQHYIAGFSEEGVCKEGISYWTYGMTYYMTFAIQLEDSGKETEGILGGEKIRRIMEFQQKCYLAGGGTICFSDGSADCRYRMGLAACMDMRDPGFCIPPVTEAMQFDDDDCFRWAGIICDLDWSKRWLFHKREEEEKQTDAPDEANRKEQERGVSQNRRTAGNIFLPKAQWAILQNGQTSVPLKGGDNDEPHNHNDIGSFYYVSRGRRCLTDLGCGEYTRAYFHEGRYQIFCNSSESHNVPIINGQFQLEGKEHRCDRFLEKEGTVELSFAGAYADGLISGIDRQISLQGETLRVADYFTLSGQTRKIEENLVTQMQVQVENAYTVLVSDPKGSFRIHICRQNGETADEPENGQRKEQQNEQRTPLVLQLMTRIHRNHQGQEEKVQIIRWTVWEADHGTGCKDRSVSTAFTVEPV